MSQDKVISHAQRRKLQGKRTIAEVDGAIIPGAKLQRRLQDQSRKARTSMNTTQASSAQYSRSCLLLPTDKPTKVAPARLSFQY